MKMSQKKNVLCLIITSFMSDEIHSAEQLERITIFSILKFAVEKVRSFKEKMNKAQKGARKTAEDPDEVVDKIKAKKILVCLHHAATDSVKKIVCRRREKAMQ